MMLVKTSFGIIFKHQVLYAYATIMFVSCGLLSYGFYNEVNKIWKIGIELTVLPAKCAAHFIPHSYSLIYMHGHTHRHGSTLSLLRLIV